MRLYKYKTKEIKKRQSWVSRALPRLAATVELARLALVLLQGLLGSIQLSKLPLGERDARLLINGGHERRQHLVDVAKHLGAITTRRLAAAGTASVPDGDLGLEAAHRLGVGLGELDVGALFNHEELQQARGTAKRRRHLGVRVGHGRQTLGLLEAAHNLGLGILLDGVVARFGVEADAVRGGVGVALLGLLLGAGVGGDLVRGGVGGLLLALLADGGLDEVGGAEPLELGGGAPDLNLLLEVLVGGLQGALGRHLGNVDVPVEGRLAGAEVRLGLGALNVALRLLHGRLGVDLGNLALLLAAALRLADVALELGLGDVDAGLVGRALVGLAGEGLKVDRVGGVLEFFDLHKRS